MGPNDNPKDYNVTKDIAKRRVYPEYEQPNGGAHTNKRGKGKLPSINYFSEVDLLVLPSCTVNALVLLGYVLKLEDSKPFGS